MMPVPQRPVPVIDHHSLSLTKQRVRIIQLLHAAEFASITPLRASRFHALAYLSDVLSPVWNLSPFEGKILKIEGGPHYPELQRELDRLVVLGLVAFRGLSYVVRPGGGSRIDGYYGLNFQSQALEPILRVVGAKGGQHAVDVLDHRVHSFLVDLAAALVTVAPEDESVGAQFDATYADARIGVSNIIDFGRWSTEARDNLSFSTAERFHRFLPEGAHLSASEKLYLYASFLSRRIHAS